MGQHYFRLAFRRLVIVSLYVAEVAAADTSSVNIDWAARTTGQQACLAPPSSGSTSANLVLSNANVILYAYTLDMQAYQLPSNDAATAPLQGVYTVVNPAHACDNFSKDLDTLQRREALFPTHRQSIALQETRDAISNLAAAINDVVSNQSLCAKDDPVAAKIADDLQGYLSRNQGITNNSGASTIQFPYQIDNGHYYVFTLRERTRYNGRLTNATLTWKCGLEDILTLSVGVMATTLPYRTYTSQSVPNGAGTQNVLTVSGSSGWTPQGLALLNYKLYVFDTAPQPGFMISTGPVFKFGGTPGVSNFGWFAGVSVSLWRRLFITPGIHLGQFADFPPAFYPGAVIPPNFGALTPVTRWSGHFALGITFQTNSLVRSNSNTPSSTPPASAK